MVEIAVWLLASAIGGILYHLGGIGKPYNTKYRDFGVPLVGVLLLWYLYPFHAGWQEYLAYFLTFGLYFGSMTTYWKKKGSDATWLSWLLTGFGYSVAFLPFAIVSGFWFGFFLRLVVCSLATMIWSQKFTNVVWEEVGRGVITTVTIPLLLI